MWREYYFFSNFLFLSSFLCWFSMPSRLCPGSPPSCLHLTSMYAELLSSQQHSISLCSSTIVATNYDDNANKMECKAGIWSLKPSSFSSLDFCPAIPQLKCIFPPPKKNIYPWFFQKNLSLGQKFNASQRIVAFYFIKLFHLWNGRLPLKMWISTAVWNRGQIQMAILML